MPEPAAVLRGLWEPQISIGVWDNAVLLSSATNLTLSRMGAIAASGSSGTDTITALAAGQTLIGGLGFNRLTGAAVTGDVFRDGAAGLKGDTIAGFAGTDTIGLTDFAPGAGLPAATCSRALQES